MTLLTKAEAARVARVHRETLNRLIREGKGPALTYVGRKPLIRQDVLEGWLQASTQARSVVVAA